MIPFSWVYIMTNKNKTTLYVGVSTDINTRVWEHRAKVNSHSFTSRYNIDMLVYFEGFDQIEKAIEREKYIKGKTRKWKDALINKVNPSWHDLSEEILTKYK
ncbi:MAG TPA: GIY-YIG nuclease family protein [Chryseolinea sp.]